MALALRVMDHFGLWHDHHGQSLPPKPRADIGILVIEEIALIKPADPRETLAVKQHEQTRHPIHRRRFGQVVVLAPRGEAKRLGHKARDCGKPPRAILNPPSPVFDQWRHCAKILPLRRRKKCGERILHNPQIGVENREIRGLALTKGLVMVGAKAKRSRVVDLSKGQIREICLRKRRIRQIMGHDHLSGTAAICKIVQQGLNQAALSVTDDGEGEICAQGVFSVATKEA